MKITYTNYGKVADSISVKDSNTLKNGDWIFAYNIDSDFVINLESLESANGMFYGCNLNSQGIENIAFNLKSTNDGVMDVGYDTTNTNAENALQKITNKGWNVLPNRHLSETSTTGKYEWCETVDDVKKVNSNYKTTDIKNGVWNEPLPSLIQGPNMFQDCTNLTTFNSDLSSLTAGYFMFDSCTNLTTFNGDLSSLTDGDNMFYCCTSLTSFNGDLSSLTYGHNMFYCCTSLTSFNGDLSSLTAGSMFEGCTNLTSFNGDLSGLTYGVAMFYNCTALTSFNSDLSSLTNGSYMFRGCKLDLSSFMRIGDTLPATSGNPIITIDLADTHDGKAINTTDEYVETVKKIYNKGWTLDVTPQPLFTYKYVDCKTINEVKNVDANYIKTDIKNGVWNEPLPRLTDGWQMFYKCTALTSFNSNLHNLTEGGYMFEGCTALTSFNGDLSSLTNAEGMFQDCTALTSFNGDLSNLTNYCGNMFEGCKLDEESVIRIAETINDISDSTESTLALGINPAIVEKDSIRAAISKIRIKGWIVNVNGGSNYPSIKKCPIITNDNFVGFRDTYPTLVQSLYHIEDGYMYDQNKKFLGVFESGGLEKSVPDGNVTANFYNSNLRTVNTDFDILVDGNHMFTASTELKSFKGNLSNLLIGYQMFAGCSSLTSFEGDLSSLECGYHLFCGGESDFSGRDQYTKLDKKSIKNIANSIQSTSQFPVRSEEQWHELIGDFFDWRGHLSLGVDPEILNDYEVNQYFKQIIDKGWTLYVNSDTPITENTINTNLNNFGVKYKNCKTVDSVKNVDANYKTTDIKAGLWNEPLPSLTNSSQMFYDCTNLTTFNCDLNSLTNGFQMFYNCDNLTTFNGDLSSLTNGFYMFQNTALTTFNGDLSSLTIGNMMFQGCKLNKKSVNNIADTIKELGDNDYLPLTLGLDDKIYKENSQSHEPFYIDKDVERDLKIIMDKGWAVDINANYTLVKNDEDKLVNTKYAYCKDIRDVINVDANYKITDIDANGVWSEPLSYYEGIYEFLDGGLFESCTSLKTFNGDLSSLTDGYHMFSSTSLTSWDQDLPNLTNGYLMFYNCTALTTFNGDLSSLTKGQEMFCNCTNLTDISFVGGLDALTNGRKMFSECTKLTTFNVNLSSLTNGRTMFSGCAALTTFNGDLRNLTDGSWMFYNCINLTTFNGDLRNLTNGFHMFQSCKLNTESIKCIADTIKNVTELTDGGDVNKGIHIRTENKPPTEEEKGYFKKMRDEKGWTVIVNDSEFTET